MLIISLDVKILKAKIKKIKRRGINKHSNVKSYDNPPLILKVCY